jgi:hypothetical protein
MSSKTTLQKLAAKRGLRIEERGPGHFQIIGGPSLVNYWPDPKRRSAHIVGATSGGRHGVTPEQAVEMAFEKAIVVNRRPSLPLTLDDPKKRTPAQWIDLLPAQRFAWRAAR